MEKAARTCLMQKEVYAVTAYQSVSFSGGFISLQGLTGMLCFFLLWGSHSDGFVLFLTWMVSNTADLASV